MNWIGIASLIGTLASVVGVGVTIYQTTKARRAAEAAATSAKQTQRAISRNVLLVDVARCVSQLDEIRTMVRSGRVEAALIRVGDLVDALARVRAVSQRAENGKLSLRKPILELRVIREQLEECATPGSKPLDSAAVTRFLTELSVSLNHWLGTQKYLPNAENSDG